MATTTSTDPRPAPPFNTGLFLGGAVVAGIGGVLGVIGAGLAAAAVLDAARQWQRRTEMTPTQLARHAASATRTAAAAGAQAWRSSDEGAAVPSPRDGARGMAGDVAGSQG